MPSRAAFTLIELLVVIAIVAVLVGVLMPVLSKVQVASRGVQCGNNLRQIGAGLLSYAGDHGGLLPLATGAIPYHTTDPATGLPGWTEQLVPYLGTDRKIFQCPASHNIVSDNAQYSYFYSSRAAYVANGGQPAPPRLSSYQSLDVAGNGVFSNAPATDADKNDNAINPAFAPMARVFHGKKPNLVFADGHVGAFAAFDPNQMNTHYNLKPDGTGYGYNE